MYNLIFSAKRTNGPGNHGTLIAGFVNGGKMDGKSHRTLRKLEKILKNSGENLMKLLKSWSYIITDF